VLSGAKSDAGDAAVIAEYLRLRQHRLRIAVPYSDDTRACGPWSAPARPGRHASRGHQPARRAAGGPRPGAKAIFADVESPISLGS